jgi:hypothetical protein
VQVQVQVGAFFWHLLPTHFVAFLGISQQREQKQKHTHKSPLFFIAFLARGAVKRKKSRVSNHFFWRLRKTFCGFFIAFSKRQKAIKNRKVSKIQIQITLFSCGKCVSLLSFILRRPLGFSYFSAWGAPKHPQKTSKNTPKHLQRRQVSTGRCGAGTLFCFLFLECPL